MKYLLILLLGMTLTFDSGESFSGPDDVVYSQPGILYQLFRPKRAKPSKTNRLLVITETGWCAPCRELAPVLEKLKKQGYDIHEYGQIEWYKAKPKPEGLPKLVVQEKKQVRVPTLLFVEVHEKKNTVKHWKRGWGRGDDEEYIKKHLTK